jgi:benzoyl-CoA reductase/2-hydroxyglutaryl-CoA dehydratase subunit BcrC/BadD/HgdB
LSAGRAQLEAPRLIETSGAVIVAEESCVGERGTRNLTDESGETIEEMMDAIVDRYFQVDCAIFTPNSERLKHIEEMVTQYNADGVIHYGLQFCQPYIIESIRLKRPWKRMIFRHSGSKPTTAWKTPAVEDKNRGIY